MAVLLYVNKVLLDTNENYPTKEKAKENMAKVTDIFDAVIDVCLDANVENFIVEEDEDEK